MSSVSVSVTVNAVCSCPLCPHAQQHALGAAAQVETRTVDRLQTGTAAWLENVNLTTAAMRAEDPHTRTKYINYQKENYTRNKDKYNAQRREKRNRAKNELEAMRAAAGGAEDPEFEPPEPSWTAEELARK